ncbi:hypothetical protein KFL_009200010, partial [Klebsormidium nitens]
ASHGRLPGLQATHVERKHLRLLRDGTCEYFVCPKDDGIRKLLICRAGRIVLLDRASNSTPVSTRAGVCDDAVLDGELVGSSFLVFDAFLGLSGRITHLPLSGRLEEARRWVDRHGGAIDDVDVKVKSMVRWSEGLEEEMKAAMAGGCTDGVVMTPDAPIRGRDSPPTLKWKPKEDITVDFLLNPSSELCVVERGTLVPVATARFPPSILASRLRTMARKGNVVVECEMGSNGADWNCRKIRTDKDSPNSMSTYRNSLRNIAEDVRFEELFGTFTGSSSRPVSTRSSE